jgi:hypothetical protein
LFLTQIEVLCGCVIVTNPGVTQLQKIVRHVGAGRFPNSGQTGFNSSRAMSSRMSNSASQDDLFGIDDNMDTLSVAASR